MKAMKRLMLIIYQLVLLTSWLGILGEEMCQPGHTFVKTVFTCLDLNLRRGHRLSWPDAAENCTHRKGGPSKNKAGYLPRLDSSGIKAAIKGVLKHGETIWIGLHYTMNNSFRWHGFPDEIPDKDFFNFGQGKASAASPYVYSDNAKSVAADYLKKNEYVCQYDAFSNAIELACPPRPMRENLTSRFTINGKLIFQDIDKQSLRVQWYGPGDTQAAITCLGNYCSQPQGKKYYNAGLSQNGFYLKYAKGVRPPSGKWRCKLTIGKRRNIEPRKIYTAACNDVYFYYPPEGINCSHEYLHNQVNVTCMTEKVFPKAKCDWTIAIKTPPDSSQSINYKQVEAYNHESYTEDYYQIIYYRSNCSIFLELIPPNPEQLYIIVDVSVKMYPDLNNLSTSTTPFPTNNILIEIGERPNSTLDERFNTNNSTQDESITLIFEFSTKMDYRIILIIGVICATLVLIFFVLYIVLVLFPKKEIAINEDVYVKDEELSKNEAIGEAVYET